MLPLTLAVKKKNNELAGTPLDWRQKQTSFACNELIIVKCVMQFICSFNFVHDTKDFERQTEAGEFCFTP